MDEDIYKKFREESLNQLKNLRPEDILFFNPSPIEEVVTIIVRPDPLLINKFQELYLEIQRTDSKQLYCPIEQLHLTILGRLDPHVDLKVLKSALQKITKTIQLKFKMWGLGSNKFASSISAYPVDFSLKDYRDNLRVELNLHGDDYSKHLVTYEYLGWINYLRYLQIPNQELLDKLFSYKDTDFGEFTPTTLEVYRTQSQILDPKLSTLLLNLEVNS